MDKVTDLQTLFVDDWLKASHGDGKADAPADNPHTQELGLTTSLYDLCSQQLLNLSAALNPNTTNKRCRALITDIRSKLAAFGDCFEHGKLESCLNVDDDLRTNVITLLHDIATVLTKGKCRRYVVIDFFDGNIARWNGDKNSGKEGAAVQKGKQVLQSPNGATPSLPSPEPISHFSKRSSSPSEVPFVTVALRQLLAQARIVLEEGGSEDDNSTATESEDESDPPLPAHMLESRCLRPLTTYVGLLMDLCPTLEQRYNDLHKTKSNNSHHLALEPISVTPAAMPYIANIQDKFPRADRELAKRLGEANWQRHERIRATQAHGPEHEVEAVLDSKSLFQPVSIFQDSALGSSIRTLSQRAESHASHSSFVSSVGGKEKDHFKVPPLPSGALYGVPFLCPYCQTMVSSINNRINWKLHVFADLNAYICTTPGCSLETFPSRKAWFDHETSYHLTSRSLQCQVCSEMFSEPTSFLQHAREHYKMDLDTPNLILAALHVATVSRPIPIRSVVCPLCLQTGWSWNRKYSTHLGRHLEEIALASLPPSGQEDEEDEEDESDSSEVGIAEADYGSSRLLSDLPSANLLGGKSTPAADDFQRKFDPADVILSTPSNLIGAIEAGHMPATPAPMPPQWLDQDLNRLRVQYPDDQFQALMRHVAIDPSTQAIVTPSETTRTFSHKYVPRIRCLDCPGKLYYPGDGTTATPFETHLKNRVHRSNVQMARSQGKTQFLQTRYYDDEAVKRRLLGPDTVEDPRQTEVETELMVEAEPDPVQSIVWQDDTQNNQAQQPNIHRMTASPYTLQDMFSDSDTAPSPTTLSQAQQQDMPRTTMNSYRQNVIADRLEAAQQDHLRVNSITSNPRAKSPFKQNSPYDPLAPLQGPRPTLQNQGASISPREVMLEEQHEEEYTIKCICGYSDDDGNTVFCERCDTWQHIGCYYERTENVPDHHFCEDCVPRRLDHIAARIRQKGKRANDSTTQIRKQFTFGPSFDQQSDAIPAFPAHMTSMESTAAPSFESWPRSKKKRIPNDSDWVYDKPSNLSTFEPASQLSSVSPMAQRMFAALKDSPGSQSFEGAHVQTIAGRMGISPDEVYKGADELLNAGLIYSTVDDDTWAVLDFED